ncbi:MAG: helix-turn-helix domain-containing protein [Cellulosilyticaceae bacterium]
MERLLIVDDEMEVVEYFESIFEQEESLKLEIFKAYSAKEALKCLEEVRIDIVLSDIKMPKITGLQLYEIIKKKWPNCKVIFLSGVLDFEYVYASIQKRDVRYLTKLEPIDKIVQTIKEVANEIEESYNQANTMRLIKKQIEEALPLLQNKFLQNLLLGVEADVNVICKRINELKIDLDVKKPMIMVAGIFDEVVEDLMASELDNNIFTVKNIAQKQFENDYNVAAYVSEQNYFVWLLQEKETGVINNSNALLNGKLEYIQKNLKHTLGITITLSYYNEQVQYNILDKIYTYIKRELGYKSRLLAESIIICSNYENNIERINEVPYYIDSQKQLVHINELEGYLELGKEKSYFALLEVTINCLKEVKSFHYGPAIEIYYRIMGILLKYINRWGLTQKLAFKVELYKLTHLELHDSWEEAVNYLTTVSKNIFEIHFTDEQKWSINAITLIYNYINNNLEKDLSLTSLADKVNLNASYLSRLFKSVTNENLYDYILKVRMNKAKELLIKTGDKIQDVGNRVGYESAQSFTRVFRKYTGKTPSEYREEKI